MLCLEYALGLLKLVCDGQGGTLSLALPFPTWSLPLPKMHLFSRGGCCSAPFPVQPVEQAALAFSISIGPQEGLPEAGPGQAAFLVAVIQV